LNPGNTGTPAFVYSTVIRRMESPMQSAASAPIKVTPSASEVPLRVFLMIVAIALWI
jgi:hypothetical protein